MPRTRLIFFQEAGGRAPVREWLRELLALDPVAHARCVARIERLAAHGHELRRPTQTTCATVSTNCGRAVDTFTTASSISSMAGTSPSCAMR
jgi:hypothetical protein